MKKVLLLVALAFGVSSSYAQLSTRENDASVEKLGARRAIAATSTFCACTKTGVCTKLR